MGACASINSAKVGVEPQTHRTIQVRPSSGHTQHPHDDASPLLPVVDGADGAVHPFGLPLTELELRALFPSHRPTTPIKEAEWWNEKVLKQSNEYRRQHAHEWNQRIIDGSIPTPHRVKLWIEALNVDEVITPLSYRSGKW